MKNKTLLKGIILLSAFGIWTVLILTVDVKAQGVNGTDVGFAAINTWFHHLTGSHMSIYVITDWLGLVPVAVCLSFAVVGLIQWIRRKGLTKVDFDIIVLGIYYVIVIGEYLFFEMIPVNFRPILINGIMEASYPSSTTLLVLSVMPTLSFQISRRVDVFTIKRGARIAAGLFSVLMVAGRLFCGVHWLTDIVGAALLSAGNFYIYKAVVMLNDKKIERL